MHNHLSGVVLATLSGLLLVSESVAQQLVRDLAQSPTPESSMPRQFRSLGNRCVFQARDSAAGLEPWVTDGTAAGTLRLGDLQRGAEGSFSQIYGEFQGRILFSAWNNATGLQLYLTDGTPTGTTAVGHLGIAITGVKLLGNGRLLLESNQETYASDLTPAGTQRIPGMVRFEPGLVVQGVVYGSVAPLSQAAELWRTDGTVAGSARIAAMQGILRPIAFVEWNGRVYFQEPHQLLPTWIASTDGQNGMVRHVSIPYSLQGFASSMHVAAGRLVFANSHQLWRSDLTAAGTGVVTTAVNTIMHLHEFAGRVYFRGAGPQGFELWTTDGTAHGTTQVADLMPGVAGSHPEHLLATPSGLYFRALLPAGRRLMRLTGNNLITDLGAIPNDAPNGTSIEGPNSGFAAFGNGLLFAANDATGDELWRYDGVVPPARLRDIATGGASSVPLTSNKAVAIRSQLHAILDDGSSGLRIWRTDGTSAGTTMLGLPITPPPTGPGSDQMARYGERLVVVTPNGISITDGTPSGTQTLLSDNRPDQSKVKVMGDTIWFTRRDHLYQSNGTVAGTTQVPFVNPIPVREWEVLPNRIVFTNQNAVFSSDSIQPATLLVTGAGFPKLHRLREDLVIIQDVTGLRATDGSLAGTVELALGGISSQPLVLMGQQAFALTSQGVLATDGTPAGTRLIANLPPTMFVRKLVATRSQLYAVASTPATGTELWRVDGSTGQLVLVHDLVTGPESGVMDAAPMGDGELLFLSGGSPATGVEPFVTDGTATGLRLLADINPGQENSNPTLLGLASDKVYLIANDGVHGAELWVLPLSATGAAAVQPYGFGCHGSAGLPQLATTSPPSPGNTLGFQLDRVRGLALAILALGLQDGNMPLSGCDLLVNQPLGSQLGNANVNGAAQFALTLPATPAVLGLSLATQGLALDGLHPRGFAASQGLRLTVGY